MLPGETWYKRLPLGKGNWEARENLVKGKLGECRGAATRFLGALVLGNLTDFRPSSYGRRNRWVACWRSIARTLESLRSSTAPSRTLLLVISFAARAFLSARGSLRSSTAACRTLRLVSSFEAMVILPKRGASFRLCNGGSNSIP